MIKRLAILASLAALSGCKTYIASDLFVSDIIAATEGEKMTAPLVISTEAGSDSSCKENAPQILRAVQIKYKDAEFIGCERIKYDTVARFRVQADIIDLTTSKTTGQAFAIGVARDGGTYHVSYITNPSATRAIWNALPKDVKGYRDFEVSPQLSAVLNNDLRDDITITTDDVFADGTPVQGTQQKTIGRRDQVELTMSDVTNAAFGTTETVSHIVSFTKP